MFFQDIGKLTAAEPETLDGETLAVGYVTKGELAEMAGSLGISRDIEHRLTGDDDHFCSAVETYDEFTIATLKVVGDAPDKEDDRIGMFFRKNFLLIVDVLDADGSTRDAFLKTVERYAGSSPTLEKITVGFFDVLTFGDLQKIEDLHEMFHSLESQVLTDKVESNFNAIILKNQEYVMKLHYYYEHILDIVQTLDDNDNGVINDGKKLYIANITRRLERLREDTDSLKNSSEHLQDAYYSFVDTRMNKTMKVLTVLTTVFFPLTIIVGWFGMNFTTMPELTWKFGYLYVIVLSITTVAVLWNVGKKRGWFD